MWVNGLVTFWTEWTCLFFLCVVSGGSFSNVSSKGIGFWICFLDEMLLCKYEFFLKKTGKYLLRLDSPLASLLLVYQLSHWVGICSVLGPSVF